MSHAWEKLSDKVFVRLDDGMVAMLDELVTRRGRNHLEVLSRAGAIRKILSACTVDGSLVIPRMRAHVPVALGDPA